MGFFEWRRHFVGVVELCEGLVGGVGADKQDVFGKRGYVRFFSIVGLPIVHTPGQDNAPAVLEADIAKLPFYTYWHTACASDVHRLADGSHAVNLADWEAFCQRLVLTGR